MQVRLIATTAPQPLPEFISGISRPLTPEDLIVFCARVSSPQNQHNLDTGERLLRYCIRNKHWSVFETASMTVEIVTSIAVSHQIVRHRSFTFQQFSQRYASATVHERPEFRMRGTTNRQGSTGNLLENEGLELRARQAIDHAFKVYEEMVGAGVANECARFVLPQCTQTRLYMTGSCRSWIHYLAIRLDSHAQKEHRLVADEIRKIFAEVFPITHAACVEPLGETKELS